MDSYFKARDILDKTIGTDAYFQIKSILFGLKAADVVSVVRCRDCIYRDGTPGQPNILCGQMHDDDFCSYGQRKEAGYVRDN